MFLVCSLFYFLCLSYSYLKKLSSINPISKRSEHKTKVSDTIPDEEWDSILRSILMQGVIQLFENKREQSSTKPTLVAQLEFMIKAIDEILQQGFSDSFQEMAMSVLETMNDGLCNTHGVLSSKKVSAFMNAHPREVFVRDISAFLAKVEQQVKSAAIETSSISFKPVSMSE